MPEYAKLMGLAPMPPCPFCEIIHGRAPTTIVRKWSDAIAVAMPRPGAPRRAVVVPLAHIADAVEDPAVTGVLAAYALELADGAGTIAIASGASAGQVIPHLSVDVFPRDLGDDEPLPWTLEYGDCPVCLSFRVRRSKRNLLTCGNPQCSYELRARKTRGNVYGDRGGGPTATEDVGYTATHTRARKQLRGQPCQMADETCSGRLEAALRPGLPKSLLRVNENGAYYCPGLDSTIAYRNLCRSHHAREGFLMAVLDRHPGLRDTYAIDKARAAHGEGCGEGCTGCATLRTYDMARVAALRDLTAPFDSRLPLPWTLRQATEGSNADA